MPLEIPDRAAKEKYEQPLARPPCRGHGQQSFQIGLLQAVDADVVNLAQFLRASIERLLRDFDGVINSWPPLCQSFEHPESFLSAAAAQFGDNDRVQQQAPRNRIGIFS